MKSQNTINKSNKKPVVSILIATIVFAFSANIAMSSVVSGIELKIFRMINNLPETLSPFFWVVTQFGSFWVLCAITGVLIIIKKYRLSLRLFVTGLTTFVLVALMKLEFVRPRPSYILDQVHIRELAIGSGFPSGHAAVATVILLVLLPYIPRTFRYASIILVILVCLSRIYLGVHAPLDVVAGAMVGIAIVSLSSLIKNKLRFVTKVTNLKLSD